MNPFKHKNPGWLPRVVGAYKTVAGKEIACGFPRQKQNAYPDGTPVAEIAARNCYGMGIPQRDFMTHALPDIEEKTKPILNLIARVIGKPNSQAKINTLSENAGQVGAQCIKDSILDSDAYQPNSPETIAKKKSSKPLIDTSHMLTSATHVVRDKSK